jgi:hypothetical protein
MHDDEKAEKLRKIIKNGEEIGIKIVFVAITVVLSVILFYKCVNYRKKQ